MLGWSVELPQDLALLLEPAAVLAIAFVSFTQGWRDELEVADAARLAGLQVFVVAAHTCRCLGLTGAGAALGLLVQALLVARNSLGLRVAWLQGRLPRARLQEQALALACVTASAVLLLARPLVAAQHGAPDLTLLITPSSCCQQGRATAGLLLAEALGAALGCLLALAACHSERWPAGNMRDMATACLLLAGGGLAHATSLALKPGSQVQALSACCCLALLLAGQALAATSAYRRTPLPSKGLMVAPLPPSILRPPTTPHLIQPCTFSRVQPLLEGDLALSSRSDLNPKTCAHFLQGVSPNTFKGGFKYAGTPIHRIVKHAYIQGGDVVDGTGKGDPGFSIADETFAVTHSEAGLLGLATSGEPHTASTQFYITLAGPLKWLDGKRVVFGKVVDQAGLDTLRRVEALTTNNERPLPELIVTAMQVVARSSLTAVSGDLALNLAFAPSLQIWIRSGGSYPSFAHIGVDPGLTLSHRSHAAWAHA
ncbi:hypothetical protein QJQ45_014793 [Haematococcus lacustris]|nr:hypothetical protein QJQ45_014793 [Haematococcus lacustris]